MSTGRIFDLKRYSIHDGPGIRTTVFFKGCSLRCAWCHNPEGIAPGFDLMHWPSRCLQCHACVSACRGGAVHRNGTGAVAVDRTACDLCGDCVRVCAAEAMQLVGRIVSADEIMAEVERDRIFYEQSGGGVTLSGGEPLDQPSFLIDLLKGFAERSIPAAVDTSGMAAASLVEEVASRARLILFDLKVMDEAKHIAQTGVSNRLILENLARLAGGPAEVWIRLPLVAGVNDDDDNIRQTIEFLSGRPALRRVSLLPYHAGGAEKAARIGRSWGSRPFAPPPAERLEEILGLFMRAGYSASLGD